MLPLGLGRNSAGLLRGGGVGSVPCALTGLSARFGHTLLRIFSPLCAGESRILRCAAKSARCGARFCGRCRTRSRAEAWPARRSPSEHCRRPGRRVLLAVRGFLRTGGRLPAGEESGFPGDVPATSWRCRSAAERSPDFPAFPAGWRKSHAAGKALSPARSRKRAECGRPGLPHSG